ncbi:hypothetical protein EJ06DRAFT_521115 [Trichodelitschia bisporula]|uniref:Lytic polysaccharide monooxygenase n=1 Tax=Trichodelitschia bisporula TaxID=703511 RepID=A0A6G1HZC3_9PEZI|nr:hypothetical protein EJ06DRAFT_521115 [Trichodelitschia bisporula]
MYTLTTLLALLPALSLAHIRLAHPQPMNTPSTSPLSPSGSDFPCQSGSGPLSTAPQTVLQSNTRATLSFSGSAVHNGGSCQVALTPDLPPTPNSKWKVIYSVLGGCPGADGQTRTYNFNVPPEVPAGSYALAWTWFNRVGNREMYMNCAAVRVQGSAAQGFVRNAEAPEGTDVSQAPEIASSPDANATAEAGGWASLPDMAIFNINLPGRASSCKTREGYDVRFPNPGRYVETGPGYNPADPVGDGCGVARAGSGSYPSAAAPSAAAPSAAASSAAAPSAAASSAHAGGSGQYTPAGNNGQWTASATTYNNGLWTPGPKVAANAGVGHVQVGMEAGALCESHGALCCGGDGV